MNVLCILKVNYSTEVLKILALAIFFLKIRSTPQLQYYKHQDNKVCNYFEAILLYV